MGGFEIKVDSKEGGFEDKYKDLKYMNYMTLKHKNGEYSQYCHIKYKGNLVKKGEKVREGQPIALSGNTGYSSEPHLHFMVFKIKPKWVPLEIRFKNNKNKIN
jgi:murein DD-endopeptidase MepM/ murein hydrolase activator NlpD